MIKDHFKEESVNLLGTKQIIYNFRDYDDIDVVDEHSRWIYNQTYGSFMRGTVFAKEEQSEAKKRGFKIKENKIKLFGQNPPILGGPEAILKYHREQTVRDILQNLRLYGRCAVIRPCSFGKTMMAYQLFEKYHKCLYLYPSGDPYSMFNLMVKINNSDSKKHSINVECHNYNWLWSLSDDEIRALDFDFVFFDEMHKLGGKATSVAAQKLIKAHQGHCNFVGATATPNRMDGRDVLGTIFHNHITYKYDLDDALRDGIIQKPHYFYTGFNVREYVKELGQEINHGKLTEEQLEKILGHSSLRQLELDELPNQIKRITEKTQPNKTYFKYIVFCQTVKFPKGKKTSLINSSIEELASEEIGVGALLKKAYPDYEINVHKFHSKIENKDEDEMTDSDVTQLLKDTQAIRDLPVKDKTIDIILSCEKLCVGYHDENVSAIMMYRTTRSHQKFTQMVGRAFSCLGATPINVFDIADNFHIKPEFNYEKGEDIKFEEVERSMPTYEEIKRMRSGGVKSNVKYTGFKAKKGQIKNKSHTDDIKDTDITKDSNNKDTYNHESESNKFFDQTTDKSTSTFGTKYDPKDDFDDFDFIDDDIENMSEEEYMARIEAAIESANKLRESITEKNPSFDDIKPIPDGKKADIPEGVEITKENEDGSKTVIRTPKKQLTPSSLDTITVKSIPKSRFEGQNYIQCGYYGHDDNMLNKSSVITENEEIDIDKICHKLLEEPEERLLQEAYKDYLEVEDIKPITSLKDITDGSENAEFQNMVIEIYAEEYNIKEQDLIAYILEKAS